MTDNQSHTFETLDRIDIDKHELFIASLEKCIHPKRSHRNKCLQNIIEKPSFEIPTSSWIAKTRKPPKLKPDTLKSKFPAKELLVSKKKSHTTSNFIKKITSNSTRRHSTISESVPEDIVRILQLELRERTARDIRIIYRYLRTLKDLSKLSEFVLTQLCSVVYLNQYEANRVVFRQGEVGTSWFIVMSGSLDVFVDGKDGESVVVAHRLRGDGFGELALVNVAPRAATILTTSFSLNKKKNRSLR
ncbi:hypothetical protein HK096_005435 [Nowakowskiella sp. JEL0078]|nr:hypothetical protein HK096_005435 [Nowakowskiella sp. JEL0078]